MALPLRNEPSSAPSDYDELYRRYGTYVRFVLVSQGINPNEVDEVVSRLFIRWVQYDMLATFDPTRESRSGEPAKFKSYLNQHIKLAARGFRDGIQKRARREPIILNQPVSASQTVSDLLDLGTPDLRFHDVEYNEFVEKVTDYLGTIPRRSKKDVCDLVLLFQRVVAQVETLGEIDIKLLMEGPWDPHNERGVIKTTISAQVVRSWLQVLRCRVGEAIELYGLPKRRGW